MYRGICDLLKRRILSVSREKCRVCASKNARVAVPCECRELSGQRRVPAWNARILDIYMLIIRYPDHNNTGNRRRIITGEQLAVKFKRHRAISARPRIRSRATHSSVPAGRDERNPEAWMSGRGERCSAPSDIDRYGSSRSPDSVIKLMERAGRRSRFLSFSSPSERFLLRQFRALISTLCSCRADVTCKWTELRPVGKQFRILISIVAS